MNNSYYFQHDYNPTNDPKIVCLIGEYGGLGYGIFWRIVEMLHQEETHKLKQKEYIYIAIAKQMLTDAKQVQEIINKCIDNYELFKSDKEYFWSDRVIKNMEKREELVEKRREAGKLGAKSRWNMASAKQNMANDGKEKKSKEKESKLINYFVFSDKTRGFLDKRDNVWKECDTFQKLGEIYLKELK